MKRLKKVSTIGLLTVLIFLLLPARFKNYPCIDLVGAECTDWFWLLGGIYYFEQFFGSMAGDVIWPLFFASLAFSFVAAWGILWCLDKFLFSKK